MALVRGMRPTMSSKCFGSPTRRAFTAASTVANRQPKRSSRLSLASTAAAPSHQRQQLLHIIVRASEEPQQQGSPFNYEEPETAKEGIDLGLVLCKQGRWSDALGIFEKSLNLPGTGVKRFRDKPRLVSDGEKMALLYNIACCHSQLQDARSGLVALAGCLEAGYTDFAQVRTDPDLQFLRTDDRFEGLMERFERKPGGFLGGFDLSSVFGRK